MLSCKKTQELLLTDYVDGFCEKKIKDEIQKHLLGCLKCQEFFVMVQETTIIPLQSLKKEVIPEEVFVKVLSKIDKRKDFLSWVFLYWREYFQTIYTPLVMMKIVIFVCFFSVIAVLGGYRIDEVKNNERNLFLAQVRSHFSEESNIIEYGTTIELFL